MILPDEPPWLTPAAARALLWILLKAHAQLTEQKETQMPNPATLTARPKEDTR